MSANATVPEQRTVLVVEGDAFARDAYVELLRISGYGALSSSNARDALRLCREANRVVDVVLTEVRLRDADGSSLVEQIREIQGTLPCALYVTAWEINDDVLGALQPNACVLQKPVEFARVEQALTELLAEPRPS